MTFSRQLLRQNIINSLRRISANTCTIHSIKFVLPDHFDVNTLVNTNKIITISSCAHYDGVGASNTIKIPKLIFCVLSTLRSGLIRRKYQMKLP